MKLFADDVKLYLKVVNDAHIIKITVCSLDTLSDWAATWQLTISVEKCCILNIGSIVAPLLSINHTPLPVLSSNRDLGVIIAHDLSHHIKLSLHVLILVTLLICTRLTPSSSLECAHQTSMLLPFPSYPISPGPVYSL